MSEERASNEQLLTDVRFAILNARDCSRYLHEAAGRSEGGGPPVLAVDVRDCLGKLVEHLQTALDAARELHNRTQGAGKG